MIQEAFIVDGSRTPQPLEHALDSTSEVGMKCGRLAAGVGQTGGVTHRRGHRRSAMLCTHAHASTTERPRTSLLLVHAVQVAHAGRAVLVRHEDFADDAVGEDRDNAVFRRD